MTRHEWDETDKGKARCKHCDTTRRTAHRETGPPLVEYLVSGFGWTASRPPCIDPTGGVQGDLFSPVADVLSQLAPVTPASPAAGVAPPDVEPAPAAIPPPATPVAGSTIRCRAKACRLMIPSTHILCAPHWDGLPKTLRAAVWSSYREKGVHSRDYWAIVSVAVDMVAVKEGR